MSTIAELKDRWMNDPDFRSGYMAVRIDPRTSQAIWQAKAVPAGEILPGTEDPLTGKSLRSIGV